MSGAPQDPELDDYLAGGSRLSREYAALGREEPPAVLDERIRAAAAAVPAAPRRRRAPLGWLRPAALAASVVLAFSLVLRLGERPPAVATSPVYDGPATVTVDRASKSAERQAPAQMASPPGLEEPAAVAAAPPAEVRFDELRVAPDSSRARESLAPASPEGIPVTDEDMESAAGERSAFSALTATTMKPAPPPDALGRAIPAIRVRVGVMPAADAAPAVVAREAAPATADDRLREVLALHDAGRRDEAVAALAAFVRDFPADPVAMLVAAP